LHTLQWRIKDETGWHVRAESQDKAKRKRLRSQEKQKRADVESSQGLTRQDAFKG